MNNHITLKHISQINLSAGTLFKFKISNENSKTQDINVKKEDATISISNITEIFTIQCEKIMFINSNCFFPKIFSRAF